MRGIYLLLCGVQFRVFLVTCPRSQHTMKWPTFLTVSVSTIHTISIPCGIENSNLISLNYYQYKLIMMTHDNFDTGDIGILSSYVNDKNSLALIYFNDI